MSLLGQDPTPTQELLRPDSDRRKASRIDVHSVQIRKWTGPNVDPRSDPPDETEFVRYPETTRIKSVHHANRVLREEIEQHPEMWWTDGDTSRIILRRIASRSFSLEHTFVVPQTNIGQQWITNSGVQHRVAVRQIRVSVNGMKSDSPNGYVMLSPADETITAQPTYVDHPPEREVLEISSDSDHSSAEAPGAAAALPTGGGVVDLTEDSD
ncbi:hypothetical protein BJ508DRAFT_332072 [Ascobolus immersus RN42]|uniref:Uncharacterized protein n=1 Tax=Ascobolus immersus RN42 TaxID=1160509 RepID=A0A3N4HNM6_ASCIM|nr:hypothetical protein BJ508DRAFT_332072 [Ascobolus immersus RN42]